MSDTLERVDDMLARHERERMDLSPKVAFDITRSEWTNLIAHQQAELIAIAIILESQPGTSVAAEAREM